MDPDPFLRQQKRAVRRSVIASVLSMTPSERSAQEEVLAGLFPGLPGYAQASSVLLYVKAFPEELDTRPFLHAAIASGKRLVCPRVDRAERRLRLFVVRSLSEDLEPGTLGILEPRGHCEEVRPGEVDWVLVPGLAFDERARRLGRGAGHYDRLLPRLRPGTPRHALAFDCQIVADLPVEPHDVPIDGVHTPSRAFLGA
ncbi:5-formyltetrahydrofolate cyclo-ligase family protein [Aquisphaera giovannonii]|uniref:5-formyltetrahydrofolate cyclo-ligase n=1 Tax=Aquisphaera giovannonii TaxID=406548 RepID=A0A5B9W1H8_9BACT|nr:5-formyltetrahydrofolate cyclo-ligase [Aquisphaera giovannonii]QEH34084.1 5-formyltetrahydrofolate cyclo-ligase family protein [Aquisphaera giovannonii]